MSARRGDSSIEKFVVAGELDFTFASGSRGAAKNVEGVKQALPGSDDADANTDADERLDGGRARDELADDAVDREAHEAVRQRRHAMWRPAEAAATVRSST